MTAKTETSARHDPIRSTMDDLRAGLLDFTGGHLADYIPQLATVDPDQFGLAVASMTGNVYASSDADTTFTIQSVSKPFVYALALADHGLEAVLAAVGAEPSGEAFNAISLEAGTGRPANPMINAGAIVTTSLIRPAGGQDPFSRVLTLLQRFAGRTLTVDEDVFASEMASGDRNRALAYLMRAAGSLHGDIDDHIERYFRQCAVQVTTRDLAVMAATLANGGVNPVSGVTAVPREAAEQVLSVMATCGMYDFSGEWLLRVGLPAKSGVSGCIVAVRPAEFGVGVFSPRVDERGNSVRGVAALRRLSSRFSLHLMHHSGTEVMPVLRSEHVGRSRSERHRSAIEQEKLQRYGYRVRIVALRGDLEFAAVERALPAFVTPAIDEPRWLVLDLCRVGRVHPGAARMLEAVLEGLRADGVTVLVADQPGRQLLPDTVAAYATGDGALSAAEDALLRSTL